jgi:hypothetical protein
MEVGKKRRCVANLKGCSILRKSVLFSFESFVVQIGSSEKGILMMRAVKALLPPPTRLRCSTHPFQLLYTELVHAAYTYNHEKLHYILEIC